MPTSPKERVRWLATAAVVVLMVLILLTSFFKPRAAVDATLLVKADDQVTSSESSTIGSSSTPTTEPQIGVDVIGAVQQPGVYYLDSSARIIDVVQAAGGFMPDADREQINLASRVADGQQIRIPRVGELAQTNVDKVPSEGGSADGTVNLNQADKATLDDLAGIGPSTAEAIIEYRTSNGPFKRIEDIQNVKGIGPALFSKIKDQITVDP